MGDPTHFRVPDLCAECAFEHDGKRVVAVEGSAHASQYVEVGARCACLRDCGDEVRVDSLGRERERGDWIDENASLSPRRRSSGLPATAYALIESDQDGIGACPRPAGDYSSCAPRRHGMPSRSAGPMRR